MKETLSWSLVKRQFSIKYRCKSGNNFQKNGWQKVFGNFDVWEQTPKIQVQFVKKLRADSYPHTLTTIRSRMLRLPIAFQKYKN